MLTHMVGIYLVNNNSSEKTSSNNREYAYQTNAYVNPKVMYI